MSSPGRLPIIWTLATICVLALISLLIWPASHPPRVEDSPSINVASMFTAATSAAERGDDAIAQRFLTRILAQQPDHHQSRLLLGQVLWNQRDNRAFDEWAKVPAEAGRQYAVANYLAGAANLDLGNAQDAESLLLLAIDIERSYLPAINALQNLYALQRRPIELRQFLARTYVFRSPTPHDLALDLLAGKELFSPEQSIDALQQMLRAEPDSVRTRYCLAAIFREAGKPGPALRQLTNDNTAEVGDSGKHFGLDSGQANSDLRSLDGFHLLLCTDLRREAESVVIARRIVDGRSTRSEDLYALGTLYLEQKDASAAETLLIAALSNTPFDASIWNRAGQAAAQAGHNARAERFLRNAVIADELERDAYLVLRGTGDTNLLAATMDRVAEHLQALAQQQRATVWKAAAASLRSGPEIAATADYLDSYATVLLNPLQNPALVEVSDFRTVWSDANLKVFNDLLSGMNSALGSAERASVAVDDGFRLHDVAEASGLLFQYEPGDTGKKLIVETIGGGVCVLDYDGDLYPDVFFPQGTQASLNAAMEHDSDHRLATVASGDRLFRNLGDGSFKDVSLDAGMSGQAYSLGCAAADIDNDGDTDIIVGAIGNTRLYRNNGDGTFQNEVLDVSPQSVTAGIGIGDFDANGGLDLWLVNYVEDWKRTCLNSSQQFSTCLPITFPAPADIRLLSDEMGGYARQLSDVWASDRGRGLGVVTLDLDNDFKTDTYVANDGTANHLYLSSAALANTASESALANGCALSGDGRAEAGMGIAVTDFNGDLLPDLFVTNFYQESNRLYQGSGEGHFLDVSSQWGLPALSLSVLGFGVQAADFNSDGWTDVIIANGHINNYSNQGQPYQMETLLLANTNGRNFRRVSAGAYFDEVFLGRGVAVLDYNLDGLCDAIVVHQDRPAALLKNSGDRKNILQIRLVGTDSNRDAIGAVVEVAAAGVRRRQWNVGSHGFMATNQRVFRFATEQAAWDHIHILWPSGRVTNLKPHKANSSLVIREDGRWFTTSE